MKDKQEKFSIGKKMYLFIIATVFTAAFGTAAISYKVSANQIDGFYKTLTVDSARNFGEMVDKEYLQSLKELTLTEEYQTLRAEAEETENEQLIEDYLHAHDLCDGFLETRNLLVTYIRNMNDVKYLYMVVCGDSSSISDMVLMDDDENPLYITGYYDDRESEFLGIDTSQVIPPTITNGDWGWLCSAYVPIYNAEGDVICHIGCDCSMDDVMTQRRRSLTYILIGALLFTIAVLIGAMRFISRIIVKPLNSMTEEMKKFQPAENISYGEAGVRQLEMKSHDEIRDIYQSIRAMQINIIDYLNHVSALQKDKEKTEHVMKEVELVFKRADRAMYEDKQAFKEQYGSDR